jgi:hypothetical protein
LVPVGGAISSACAIAVLWAPFQPAAHSALAARSRTGQTSGVLMQGGASEGSDDRALLGLFRAIASGDQPEAARRLGSSPRLAHRPIRVGASRRDGETYFIGAVRHQVYAGDTALHVAAAAYQPALASELVVEGAEVRARNRRGAEPLHYAATAAPTPIIGTRPRNVK